LKFKVGDRVLSSYDVDKGIYNSPGKIVGIVSCGPCGEGCYNVTWDDFPGHPEPHTDDELELYKVKND